MVYSLSPPTSSHAAAAAACRHSLCNEDGFLVLMELNMTVSNYFPFSISLSLLCCHCCYLLVLHPSKEHTYYILVYIIHTYSPNLCKFTKKSQ